MVHNFSPGPPATLPSSIVSFSGQESEIASELRNENLVQPKSASMSQVERDNDFDANTPFNPARVIEEGEPLLEMFERSFGIVSKPANLGLLSLSSNHSKLAKRSSTQLGNNTTGRRGKPRCSQCRKRKIKVLFSRPKLI